MRSRLACTAPALRLAQTLKHFVRDWSEVGKAERDALFPPILEALREEFGDEVEGKKVLVPGCGLARLAYEIACEGASPSSET
jgi:carnosine N-methyltransferase